MNSQRPLTAKALPLLGKDRQRAAAPCVPRCLSSFMNGNMENMPKRKRKPAERGKSPVCVALRTAGAERLAQKFAA